MPAALLWDALVPALALRVTDKGHKSFIVQRRVNGRMVKLTLGDYPALNLKTARSRAREALGEMERGVDPRQKTPRVTASGLRRDSVEAAIESYITRDVEKNQRPRSQIEVIRPLRRVLAPRYGTLGLSEITPRHLIEILDDIVDAGSPVAANRTHTIMRRFFGWCVERQLISVNPAIGVRKPHKEEARTRVLSDEELGELWRAAEAMGWPFGSYMQGLILTGQRRNELAGLALVRAKAPALVLLDIYLPDRSGWRVLQALKHDPKTQHMHLYSKASCFLTRRSLRQGTRITPWPSHGGSSYQGHSVHGEPGAVQCSPLTIAVPRN